MNRCIGWLVFCLLAGCQSGGQNMVQETDDGANRRVFHNGLIYTVNPDQPTAEALVVEGEKIVFVGSKAQALQVAGAGASQTDLHGGMLLPGLIDAHLHPVRGSLKDLYSCNFPFSASPREVQSAVAQCVAGQPQAEWIIGGQWDSAFFQNHTLDSPRKLLDAVSEDKPVLLSDDSLHNVWVNSRALAIAGITADTPDPAGGTIVREADGQPNGVLLEAAAKMIREYQPEYSEAQVGRAIDAFMITANGFGLTGIKGASSYPFEAAGWHAADQGQGLSLHVALSLRSQDGQRKERLDYSVLEQARERYRGDNVHTDFVKLFLDGVPTPARTAGMLAPYVPNEAHGDQFRGGPLLIDPKALADDVIALDQRGFTIKIHAAGDRSVRVALDAIEAARQANGSSGLRHELAHAGYISDADLPRFAALNAVADLSPYLWYPSPIMEAIYQAVGKERGHRYFPVRDLLDSGAHLLTGSDWPAVAVDANPWVGMESLVTRRHPLNDSDEALWPAQAISIEEAIRIYTIQGAMALRLEHQTGSLEPGKLADFIVLGVDLLTMPASDISSVQPQQTWFRGRQVFPRIDE